MNEEVRRLHLEHPDDYIFACLPLTRERHLSVPALFRSLNESLLRQVKHWLPSNEAQDPQSLFQYLVEADNVILSPHVAGWTIESKEKLAQTIVNKVKDHFL